MSSKNKKNDPPPVLIKEGDIDKEADGEERDEEVPAASVSFNFESSTVEDDNALDPDQTKLILEKSMSSSQRG
jgi:hypothetical protein